MNDWKQAQIDHFNKLAGNYNSNKRSYYVDVITDKISYLVHNKDVLYIGCGTGIMLNGLTPKSVHGIDISPRMIEIARIYNPWQSFEVADAEAFIPKRRYDVAMFIDCIDHIQDWRRAINNVRPFVDIIIITTLAKKWHPLFRILGRLKLKMDEGVNKWISPAELHEFLGDCEKTITKYGLVFTLTVVKGDVI